VPTTGDRPLARSTDLIIEELGAEILVYDTDRDRAHSLSPEAAKVWRACDGETSAEELSSSLELDPNTVARALDELSGCDLLEEPPTLAPVAEGSTRREATIKLAKVGAAVAAAPLIVSVAAPTAAMAVSPAVCAQFSSNDCGGTSADGCSQTPGCCCCTPPVHRDKKTGLFPGGPTAPCNVFELDDDQCKSCVPTDQALTLCSTWQHSTPGNCSAEG